MPRRPCNDWCYQRVTLASGAPRRPDPAHRAARMSTGGRGCLARAGLLRAPAPLGILHSSAQEGQRAGRNPLQCVTSMQPPRGCGVLGHTQVPRRPRGTEPAASAERDPGASEGLGEGALQVRRPRWPSGPQPQGHIPPPGKRNFPIDVPSKEVCPAAGRSAQAPAPQGLRNAEQKDTQRGPPSTGCALSLSFPLGVPLGVSAQPPTPHIW